MLKKENIKTFGIVLVAVMVGLAVHQVVVSPRIAAKK